MFKRQLSYDGVAAIVTLGTVCVLFGVMKADIASLKDTAKDHELRIRHEEMINARKGDFGLNRDTNMVYIMSTPID